MFNQIYTILILLFCFTSALSQSSIENLSQTTDQVIEGKVIRKESFVMNNDRNIYTRNTIQVLKVFKGEVKKEVEIITLGGEYNGRVQSWSHSFDIALHDHGIFFLIESSEFENTYAVISDYEGFISISNHNGHDVVGYGFKKEYKNIGKELYEPLKEINENLKVVKLNSYEEDLVASNISIGSSECAQYTIRNLEVIPSNDFQNSTSFYVEFDIDIRSLQNIFKLRKSEITMEYSTSLLGENIVGSNNITATLGGDFQNYTLGLFDAEPNKVTVNIEKIIGEVAVDVNTFQANIYHASIFIQNFDLAGVLGLSVNENFDLTTLIEEGEDVIEIECNEYNEDITISVNNLLPITIEEYNQEVYAGTKTLLTIEGENFLDNTGSFAAVEVWFTNAENADIFEWVKPYAGDYLLISDDLIQVYVPSYALDINGSNQNKEYAGSGVFKIVHRLNGATIEESDEKEITVTYAVRNRFYQTINGSSSTQPVMLTTGVTDNEYVVAFSPDFALKQDANGFYFKDAFGRALNSWCNTTNLNFVIDENAYQSGNFDLLVELGIPQNSSALASTSISSFIESNCAISLDNGSINHPEIHEVDFIDDVIITFNDNIALSLWDAKSLVPATLYSVEQVALHELGHSHGLLHTNHSEELMYYAANSATTITSESVSASNYLQNHSQTQLCLDGVYQANSNCTTGTIDLKLNGFVSIKTTYIDQEIIVESKDLRQVSQVQIFDTNVMLLKSVKNVESDYMIIPFHNVNGVFIISFTTDFGVYSDKLFIAN